ncbi:NYN domain-containing protein [Photobacterium lutimaris]|uniref:NYN domain-containing protein n=1 Tax=Photobacterium lutimaris TaxID=388278 RepID=A0A2T3ITM8_9GAMM|nr:NYN domain-containing protein [Photobacterium lutimaris]PSU31719.1 hypothetical protein C9I99_21265 [Photobacterium lutimaris]TDR72642.1 NYN domain-containing protein [Photobacterium lutimaris]
MTPVMTKSAMYDCAFVLVDIENISSIEYEQAIEIACCHSNNINVSTYGDAKHKPDVKGGYKNVRHVECTYKGKNSADIALSLQALELGLSEKVPCIIIVSSDSDFSIVATKLRAIGVDVYGVGSAHTKPHYVETLNLYYNVTKQKSTFKSKKMINIFGRRKSLCTQVFSSYQKINRSNTPSWVELELIEKRLRKTEPNFCPSFFGAKSLDTLIRSMERFDICKLNGKLRIKPYPHGLF